MTLRTSFVLIMLAERFLLVGREYTGQLLFVVNLKMQ
jgi:hypothetical protein